MKNQLINCSESLKRAYEIALLGNHEIMYCIDTKLPENEFITRLENAKYIKNILPINVNIFDNRYSYNDNNIYFEIHNISFDKIITNNQETIETINNRIKEKLNNPNPIFNYDKQNIEFLKKYYNTSNVSIKDYNDTILLAQTIAKYDNSECVLLEHISEAILYKMLVTETYLRNDIDYDNKYFII